MLRGIACKVTAAISMAAMIFSTAGFLPGACHMQVMAAESESEPENSLELPSDPQSVVALSKSVGDLWLISGGTLAGITDDGMKMEGIGDAKSIGSLAKPSLESILALDPDLVLLTADLPSHKKIGEDLKSSGIAVCPIAIGCFDDYASYVKAFTGITGRDDLYKKNVEEVKSGIQDVLINSDADVVQRTYLELRVSATKNKVLKNDYFASEIFNDFGMENIAQDNSSLDDLSVEAILAADPDYIFVIPQGKEDEAEKAYEDAFTSDPAWSELSAVKEDHVFTMPKDLFQYKPDARWAEAYQYVDDILSEDSETETEG